jgi:hypothetical protein
MRTTAQSAGFAAMLVTILSACASPAPSDAASPAASSSGVASPVVVVPSELHYLWLGETAFISLHPDGTLGYAEDQSWQVSAVGDDVIEVTAIEDAEGCSAGDVGRYRWSLTPSGATLTLEAIQDDCSARLASLEGSFSRSDCPAFPADFCLGDLTAEEHVATFFNPLVPGAEWEGPYFDMTYTVPEGWANNWDEATEYLLQPQSAVGETGIYMWSETAIVSQSAPCSPRPEPTIERTPTAMVGWLVNHPTLVSTDPMAVSIGGLDGLMVDASVPSGATLPCVGDGRRYIPMLVNAEARGMQWGFPPEGHKRLYFLDLGEARTLVISIEAEDEATYRSLVDEATTIVESIGFRG